MSYLQIQRNQRKKGGQFVYVHLARSVWDAVRGRSVQRRVYLGRLEASGLRLVLSKGSALRRGVAVELAGEGDGGQGRPASVADRLGPGLPHARGRTGAVRGVRVVVVEGVPPPRL